MGDISPLREQLNRALDRIMACVALSVCRIDDPDQLRELLTAKEAILAARDLDEDNHSRL